MTAGYGVAPVLESTGLSAGSGEFVTVPGANGAGKSTLMRALSGLHRPVEGRVVHEGRAEELRKDPALERACLGEFG